MRKCMLCLLQRRDAYRDRAKCDFSCHEMFMQITGESKPLRMAFLFGALNEVAANEIKSLFNEKSSKFMKFTV